MRGVQPFSVLLQSHARNWSSVTPRALQRLSQTRTSGVFSIPLHSTKDRSLTMLNVDWMPYARSLIGVREIKGPKHSPTIMGWIKSLGAKRLGINVRDDETPWCGTFAAQVMVHSGIEPPAIAVRASEWGKWGRKLLAPRPGCILTFTREGGGHVGFYVGEDNSHLHVLGGNQGNAVSITRIARSRLSEMRWPVEVPLPPAKIVRLSPGGTPITANER